MVAAGKFFTRGDAEYGSAPCQLAMAISQLEEKMAEAFVLLAMRVETKVPTSTVLNLWRLYGLVQAINPYLLSWQDE